MMHVNNETGVIQPVGDVADGSTAPSVYLHVDAAQSFGQELAALRHPRIDLISVSGHKINGPKGVGALVMRRRNGRRPPLQPLMFGGGQERGLRPGTLPVPLVAGFGLAAELAVARGRQPRARCRAFRESLLAGLAPLEPVVNGDPARSVPYILNLSFPGIEAETRHRGVERPRRDLERRRLHVAVLHLQSRPQRDGPAGVAEWTARCGSRGARDSPEPDWRALVAAVEPLSQRGTGRNRVSASARRRRSSTGARGSRRTCRAIGAIRRRTTGCSKNRPASGASA